MSTTTLLEAIQREDSSEILESFEREIFTRVLSIIEDTKKTVANQLFSEETSEGE